jgi:hypothetical protein
MDFVIVDQTNVFVMQDTMDQIAPKAYVLVLHAPMVDALRLI